MVKVFSNAPAPAAGAAGCPPEKDQLKFEVPVKVTTTAKADCSRILTSAELNGQ